MKLIQTKDYLLLIDEEAEIKENDYTYKKLHNGVIYDKEIWEVEKNSVASNYPNIAKDYRDKIIAHYPLTKEAKELDLPLLTPFEEVDIIQLSKDYAMKNTDSIGRNYSDLREAFEDGYKAAQSKQFTLEDMKKAFKYYAFTPISKQPYNVSELEEQFEKFIQLLSTQQLPKEFVPEYEAKTEFGPFKLKTITNSEGKEEIQGTYKY